MLSTWTYSLVYKNFLTSRYFVVIKIELNKLFNFYERKREKKTQMVKANEHLLPASFAILSCPKSAVHACPILPVEGNCPGVRTIRFSHTVVAR